MILRDFRTVRRWLSWDLPPVAKQRYSGMRAEQMVPVFRKLVATFETRMEPGDASRNCFVLDAVSYSRIILYYLSCSQLPLRSS